MVRLWDFEEDYTKERIKEELEEFGEIDSIKEVWIFEMIDSALVIFSNESSV